MGLNPMPQPKDEPDADTITAPAEAPQATPAIPEAKVAVESQQAAAAAAPATPTTPSTRTRSDAAKANIKEGLRPHQIAGRTCIEQMVPVGNQVSAINLFHVHLSTELGKFFKFGFFALNGFRRTSIQSEVRQVRGYDVCKYDEISLRRRKFPRER